MILSGRLTTDRVDRAATSTRLSARIADIDARRRAAELSVDALVGAWRDSAGRHHEDAWQQWEVQTLDTIDALSALLAAVDLARADIAADRPAVAVPRQVDRRTSPRVERYSELDRRPTG